jgi:stage II sporulation protein D
MTLGQADRKLGSLVKGAFRGIEVVRRGRSPRIVEAEVIGTRGRTLVTGGQLRARLGLYDTWAFFTSITTGKEPAPEDPGPPTGGAEPFGSAAWLRAHTIGMLSGRVLPVLKSRRALVQRREGARWVDVAHVKVRRGGRYRYRVTAPGVYRLRYHDEHGPAVRVR